MKRKPVKPKPKSKSRNRIGYPCRSCGAACDALRTTKLQSGLQRIRRCTKCGRKFITKESDSISTPTAKAVALLGKTLVIDLENIPGLTTSVTIPSSGAKS